MVASPFSLMGKLVPGGGDGEELQHLTFEPGSAAIAPSELKKIDALMKGLEERPGLRLEITGTADPTRDRQAMALQKLHELLRSRWRQENGSTAEADLPVSAEGRLITPALRPIASPTVIRVKTTGCRVQAAHHGGDEAPTGGIYSSG